MSSPPRPGDRQPQPGQPGSGPVQAAPPATRVQSGESTGSGTPPPATPPYGGGTRERPSAAQQRQPLDLATRLDGQRGWLNELEQSLRKRSIIALVLTCLAVGVGAAALFVSITKNADGDRIDALESRITALETATGAPSGTVPPDTGTVPPDTGTIPPTTGTPDVDGGKVGS